MPLAKGSAVRRLHPLAGDFTPLGAHGLSYRWSCPLCCMNSAGRQGTAPARAGHVIVVFHNGVVMSQGDPSVIDKAFQRTLCSTTNGHRKRPYEKRRTCFGLVCFSNGIRCLWKRASGTPAPARKGTSQTGGHGALRGKPRCPMTM